jgi:hypothetical protein
VTDEFPQRPPDLGATTASASTSATITTSNPTSSTSTTTTGYCLRRSLSFLPFLLPSLLDSSSTQPFHSSRLNFKHSSYPSLLNFMHSSSPSHSSSQAAPLHKHTPAHSHQAPLRTSLRPAAEDARRRTGPQPAARSSHVGPAAPSRARRRSGQQPPRAPRPQHRRPSCACTGRSSGDRLLAAATTPAVGSPNASSVYHVDLGEIFWSGQPLTVLPHTLHYFATICRMVLYICSIYTNTSQFAIVYWFHELRNSA